MVRYIGLLLALVISGCATPSRTARVIHDEVSVGESLGKGATVTRVHGVLTMEVALPDRRVLRRQATNAWPDAGEAYLVNAWRGLVELSHAKYHALGQSSAPFAENQTSCQDELTNQYTPDNTRATGTLSQGATPSTFRSIGKTTIDQAAVTIREFCLMTRGRKGK
jgi:hypothetical protein